MIFKQNEKLALDIRSGSFCIYRKDTHQALSSGEVGFAAFGNDHDKMCDFAVAKFDELSASCTKATKQ